MPIDAQALWADKYAARFAAAKFQEDTAREQAFIDDTHIVYGERLRGMTPRDLLHLQVISSPLIYGGQEIKPAHILQFLWALNVKNKGIFRFYYRQRMVRRVLGRKSINPTLDSLRAISDYIGTMFMDAGGKSSTELKPIGACWLAPILVRVAKMIGSVDPLDGRAWGDVPLPRIWQYLKSAKMAEDPKSKDYSPSDNLINDWQHEVNKLSNGI